MKKTLFVLMVVIAVAAGSAFMYLRAGHVYEVSQAAIQTQVESQFPVEKCVLVFCIELDRPVVELNAGEKRIEFGSNALMEVAFSSDQYDGTMGFSGELVYEPERQAFFLDDSRLEYLDVKNISEKHRDNVNNLASLLVSEYLRANPIYSFKGTPFESVAPWLELKEVEMRDGVLRLRIGLAI